MFRHDFVMLLDGYHSGNQDETRSKKRLPLGITFQTGSVRRAAQIYFVGPFEMTFHSECMAKWGPERRATQLGKSRQNKVQEKQIRSELLSKRGP